MSTFEKTNGSRVGVEFVGTALGLFGRGLLTVIVSALVIPAPWMTVWYWRWWFGRIKLSDQTEVSFSGEGSQIWFPIMAQTALAYVWIFAPFRPLLCIHIPPLPRIDLLSLLLMPLNCYLGLIIIRWFWRNVVPSDGTKISFVGAYLPFLGWSLLVRVSIITIIGWAWAVAGMIRWVCRNIKADNHIVEFHGNGWNILWRTLVFGLSCILIIPIPWTSLWTLKWYIRNVSIQRATT